MAEHKQFLLICRGSLYEVLAILEIAHRRGYLSGEERMEIRGMMFPLLRQVNSLIRYLKK